MTHCLYSVCLTTCPKNCCIKQVGRLHMWLGKALSLKGEGRKGQAVQEYREGVRVLEQSEADQGSPSVALFRWYQGAALLEISEVRQIHKIPTRDGCGLIELVGGVGRGESNMRTYCLRHSAQLGARVPAEVLGNRSSSWKTYSAPLAAYKRSFSVSNDVPEAIDSLPCKRILGESMHFRCAVRRASAPSHARSVDQPGQYEVPSSIGSCKAGDGRRAGSTGRSVGSCIVE